MNDLFGGLQFTVPCEALLQDARPSELPSGSESLAMMPGPDTVRKPCRVYESLTAIGGELGAAAAQPELLRRYIVAPSKRIVVMRSNIAGRIRRISLLLFLEGEMSDVTSFVKVNTNGSGRTLCLLENCDELSFVVAWTTREKQKLRMRDESVVGSTRSLTTSA